MNRQLAGLDVLLLTGFGNETLDQRTAFLVSNHPADHVPAENVQDYIQIEIGPLYRPD